MTSDILCPTCKSPMGVNYEGRERGEVLKCGSCDERFYIPTDPSYHLHVIGLWSLTMAKEWKAAGIDCDDLIAAIEAA